MSKAAGLTRGRSCVCVINAFLICVYFYSLLQVKISPLEMKWKERVLLVEEINR